MFCKFWAPLLGTPWGSDDGSRIETGSTTGAEGKEEGAAAIADTIEVEDGDVVVEEEASEVGKTMGIGRVAGRGRGDRLQRDRCAAASFGPSGDGRRLLEPAFGKVAKAYRMPRVEECQFVVGHLKDCSRLGGREVIAVAAGIVAVVDVVDAMSMRCRCGERG